MSAEPSLDPSELVVVLGPEGSTVLDVGTVDEVLAHLTSHVASHAGDRPVRPRPPGRPVRDRLHEQLGEELHEESLRPLVRRPVDQPDPVPLRFFRAVDGELLHLRPLSDWWTFELAPAGASIGAGGLEAEVRKVFAEAAPAVATVTAGQHEAPPQLPPAGTWTEQLEEIRQLVASNVHHDRRGWAHNFFVHGWT